MQKIDETIEEIYEISSKNNENGGYRIKTNKQIIEIKISKQGQYHEEFGYVCSDDNLDDYVGAVLENIVLVDKELKAKCINQMKKKLGEDWVGSAFFVNIETNKGIMQFALYNFRDGYYGNEVIVSSQQLDLETRI